MKTLPKESEMRIGRTNYIVHRHFVGKTNLKQLIERLILTEKMRK